MMNHDRIKLLVLGAVSVIVVTCVTRHTVSSGPPRLQGADAAKIEFFEAKVRPLLATYCYDCHTDSAASGLRVDSARALLQGGTRGPAMLSASPQKACSSKPPRTRTKD